MKVIVLLVLGALAAATPVHADFPADGTAPTEGWIYGFRSVIDTSQFPLASDKESASGMSQEAAWKSVADWPPLASSGGSFASLGRPDTVVAYIEGGVNYWRNGNTELIKKIYINRAEVMANPVCAARYVDNGDPWFNVLDFPGTPDHNGNGILDPEDLIIECENGVDDDGNGYVDDISGWDFYNQQNNPHSQDVTYGHHNTQMLAGEAAINDGGRIGACPLCMVMPIRAGSEALDRSDDLAQAFLFAADSGAASVASLTADLGYSSFMREAQEYLWRHDVVVAESSNDFDSTDHQGGMYWPHAVAGNGVVKDTEGSLPLVPGCIPGTPLCPSTDVATRTFRQRSGETSWGTRNMVSVSGTASTSASTGTLGGVLGLFQSYGRTAAELGYVSSPLTGPEIIQLMIATASDIDPSDYTFVPNAWPTHVGWDLQTGYGRINVARFQSELRQGRIRPVAWLDSPEWFSLYDPTVQTTVPVYGHTEARRAPGGTYTWTLEWALGAEPTSWSTIAAGTRNAPFDGKLGDLDLSAISAAYAAPFALSNDKQLSTTEQYTVTLRVRVSYDKTPGVTLSGEERRSIAVHHDPDAMAGFPHRVRSGAACAGGYAPAGGPAGYCYSPGGESQPALVDLAGLGHLQLVYGDSDGFVHAVDPTTGAELPGFPAATDTTVVEKPGGWPGVNPGHEPVPINVAVGDLDHDGNLWIVAATSTGKLYVWGADGARRPGWPVKPAAGVVPLESPRIPREYSRLPHEGLFAAPILSDWDGDGTLEIIEAGYDGHIHLYHANGSELTSGNWPIQVRVPDSVPISRPTLNNPTDTRTPIRMQDFRISSSPALAQLDDDPELEIVVRSQMSDTFPSTDIEALSGVGHLMAFDHDGTYLWTANMDSFAFYYGSAQEFITEGSNSPAVADIDGDGKDEVVSNAVFSTSAYAFKGDGTAFGAGQWTSPPIGPPNPALPIPDLPLSFTTSGAFGLFGGTLTYAQTGSGAVSIIGALLTAGSGLPILNKERAWTAATGTIVPGFPASFQGLNFLSAPIIADVTGDGLAEIIDGGDSSAMHAFGVGGLQAPLSGFPKFTNGWVLWSPAVGDLDSDGTVELVTNTREGNTFVWHTAGLASANTEWWRYRHDEWNTGRYGVDSRPPGIIRSLTNDPVLHRISFIAPGDDWYAGQVDHYRIVHGGGTVDLPAMQPAGGSETLTIPTGITSGTVQGVDDRGNLGKPAPFDVSGAPIPTPTATPAAAVCGALTTTGCRQTVAAHQAQLQIKLRTPNTKNRLLWKWKGAATTTPEFGNPLAATGYDLCIYDGNANLIGTAAVPAGGTCNAASPRPCWRASTTGYRYSDRDLTPAGVQQVQLKAGIAGKAKIVLKGRGALLDLPDLPVTTLPLRVQMIGANGACFEATYSTTGRNEADQLKAKSD
ncbi:MAG TPA: hypothetical protein VGK30_08405 [Candidatus Binatia bacterium]|jgi:hypothetical protein